ncbi:MAG TPA: NADH-quinone oxidoreductase subunit NuoB [Candidatus Omnitrophota bacterium]|nr:NADH-quinone oxidoreductase subunit NuoB [Candidatus Omnitrophota bacterium]
MLKNIIQGLRQGVVTTRYPVIRTEPPERFRGAPEPVIGRSFRDLSPASVCPTAAITSDPERGIYTIDLARCVFCGKCADKSREGAIRMSGNFELSSRLKKDLLIRCVRDAAGNVAESSSGPVDTNTVAERVSRRIRSTLGKSLHLRHLDAGSCNACDWELTALLAPHYDVRRLSIDFVASPRHADGVIVTGSVTRNLEEAVRRTFEAVPEPRVVIAVGACASSGGIVGTSYASTGGVDKIIPVDVYIPGCPPRPEAILFGILMAVGRIQQNV